MHVYEVRARRDHRAADLISDALPFGRLWYGEPGHQHSFASILPPFSRAAGLETNYWQWPGPVTPSL
jgi:hypothetical protein